MAAPADGILPSVVGSGNSCAWEEDGKRCGAKFGNQDGLMKHIRADHSHRALLCVWCGTVGNFQSRYLQKHVRECFRHLLAEVRGEDVTDAEVEDSEAESDGSGKWDPFK